MSQTHTEKPGALSLDKDRFEEFRGIIYRHSGIFFEENKRYLLESRLLQRMQVHKTRSFADYREMLVSSPGAVELHELMNAVTINETYFFRHPEHLHILEHHVIPSIVARQEGRDIQRVRIWSAACSSGDEAYTIAILIRDRLQPRYPRVVFEIVGSDIDSSILAAARRATYAPYAVRNVPEELLQRHFTREGDRYLLKPAVRELVRFRQLNLNDDAAMRNMRSFDVIFCANVLIYFDTSSKRQVIEHLRTALNPDGHLFVGFSETLFGVTDAFVGQRYDKSIVYRPAPRNGNGAAIGPAPTLSVRKEASILQS
jgi:chemotaxis protein methyltransferase CheR